MTAQPAVQPPAAYREIRRAEVVYADGLLSVSAKDSSLNQILREISLETGIKMTGRVAEERVFGHYGPSTPSQILAALLEGTGSNMLLLAGERNSPGELILTPRQGGPTPPNLNASVLNEQPEPADPAANANGGQTEALQPTAAPQASATPISPSTNAATSPTATEPQSPNGVKTPQQIYDQLQRLRTQTPPQ